MSSGLNLIAGLFILVSADDNGYFPFYRRVRIVIFEAKIFELEIVNIFYFWIQFHNGKWSWFALKLFLYLIYVIFVNMYITEGMNKFPNWNFCHVSKHQGQ